VILVWFGLVVIRLDPVRPCLHCATAVSPIVGPVRVAETPGLTGPNYRAISKRQLHVCSLYVVSTN
jgi:hypothetical protein